jgi:hypothetical protein
MAEKEKKERSSPMIVWEDAVFAFDKVLDEYDTRVSAILAGIDPLCLAMFKRSLARARKRGKKLIARKLWRQSKERHSGFVQSRNSKGQLSVAERRKRRLAREAAHRKLPRVQAHKRGRGTHKRGPRTVYRTGHRTGHHRISGTGKQSGAYITGRTYFY